MSVPERSSLPPMGATEFAIEKAFRHYGFALGLLIGWAALLLPLVALAWYVALRDGMPDIRSLSPAAIGALGLLGVGALLASFSIEVNWNRRILLDEPPGGCCAGGWMAWCGATWLPFCSCSRYSPFTSPQALP